jgi:hypothetical protein
MPRELGGGDDCVPEPGEKPEKNEESDKSIYHGENEEVHCRCQKSPRAGLVFAFGIWTLIVDFHGLLNS